LRIVRFTITLGSTVSRGRSGSISATLLARRFTFRAIRRVSLRRRWAAVDALRVVRRTAFFALPALRAILALADLGRRAEAGRAAGRRGDFFGLFLVIAMVSLPPVGRHADKPRCYWGVKHGLAKGFPDRGQKITLALASIAARRAFHRQR